MLHEKQDTQDDMYTFELFIIHILNLYSMCLCLCDNINFISDIC